MFLYFQKNLFVQCQHVKTKKYQVKIKPKCYTLVLWVIQTTNYNSKTIWYRFGLERIYILHPNSISMIQIDLVEIVLERNVDERSKLHDFHNWEYKGWGELFEKGKWKHITWFHTHVGFLPSRGFSHSS